MNLEEAVQLFKDNKKNKNFALLAPTHYSRCGSYTLRKRYTKLKKFLDNYSNLSERERNSNDWLAKDRSIGSIKITEI